MAPPGPVLRYFDYRFELTLDTFAGLWYEKHVEGGGSLISRALSALVSLGLSKYEALAYVSLLKNKKVTGYELSKITGIPSSRIYSILNALLRKGFIIALDSGPVCYYPRPPSEVFSNLLREYEHLLAYLNRELQKVYLEQEEEEILAWNIHGRKAIIQKAKEMVREAKETVLVALWKKEWRPLSNTLKQAFERGLKITILAYGNVEVKFGDVYHHHASDPSYREVKARKFIAIADRKKLLFATFPKGIGLWSRDLELTRFFRDFIVHEIYLMKIKSALPQEIESQFGKEWEEIRIDV